MTRTATSRDPLAIDDRGLLALRARPGTRLQVLAGTVLLTAEDRREEALVPAGGEFPLGGAGLVLLEGIGASRVRLVPPASRSASVAAWLGAPVRRAAAALRRWRARLQLGPADPLAEV